MYAAVTVAGPAGFGSHNAFVALLSTLLHYLPYLLVTAVGCGASRQDREGEELMTTMTKSGGSGEPHGINQRHRARVLEPAGMLIYFQYFSCIWFPYPWRTACTIGVDFLAHDRHAGMPIQEVAPACNTQLRRHAVT